MTQTRPEILPVLAELGDCFPDMRFGQLVKGDLAGRDDAPDGLSANLRWCGGHHLLGRLRQASRIGHERAHQGSGHDYRHTGHFRST